MSQEELPMSFARYMYTELLSNPELKEMSSMPNRLDGQRLCWRESSCFDTAQACEEEER